MLGSLISAAHDNYSLPLAQMHLVVLENLNMRKIVQRAGLARQKNVAVKTVVFEYGYANRLPCGEFLHAVFGSGGPAYIQELFPGTSVYRRRKVVYSTDGTSSVSPNMWQVIMVWNDNKPAASTGSQVFKGCDTVLPSPPPELSAEMNAIVDPVLNELLVNSAVV